MLKLGTKVPATQAHANEKETETAFTEDFAVNMLRALIFSSRAHFRNRIRSQYVFLALESIMK